MLLNPIHADITDPVLWRCEADGQLREDRGLKVGYRTVTTVEIVPLPVVTTEQRVRFAILCALEVYRNPSFVMWADKWMSGSDRSMRAAGAAIDLIAIARKAVS